LGSLPVPPPHPYYAYTAAYWESQRVSKIDNTKTGLLLLIIGIAIAWVPFVSIIGGIIALIGAILVILGREAFGHPHTHNVTLSIIFFFVGLAVSIVGAIFAFILAVTSVINNDRPVTAPSQFSIGALLIPVFIVLIAGGAISGLAEVFLTLALQAKKGRQFLWIGYATSIIVSVVNIFLFVVFGPALSPIFFLGGGFGFYATSLFGFIPAIFFAIAFYWARDRINRREIPPPIQPSGTYYPPSSPTVPASGQVPPS
jgi:MFS family permease